MYPAEWSGIKKLLMLKAASRGGSASQTETLSDSLVTFETTKARPLTQCRVDFLPKQSGSGDPSPENVRPISGWNEVNVCRSGKNLFDGRLVNKNVNANGSENDATNRLSTLFESIKAGTYTLSFDSNFVCALYVFSSDQVGSQIAEESNIYWNASPLTFNITNGKYYRIKFKHNTDKSIVPSDLTDVQVEVGSTATPYEPYTATSYPITWQSSGTVYGGYVDLVRGVLVATHTVAILKKSDFGSSQTGTAIPYRQSDAIFPICDSGISWSKARTQQLFNYGKIANPYSESSYGNYIGVVIFQTTLSTTNSYVRISEAVYEAMGDDDEAVISYVLSTPITYTLTPQQITTIIGTNNIWSDAGDVTVTYTK